MFIKTHISPSSFKRTAFLYDFSMCPSVNCALQLIVALTCFLPRFLVHITYRHTSSSHTTNSSLDRKAHSQSGDGITSDSCLCTCKYCKCARMLPRAFHKLLLLSLDLELMNTTNNRRNLGCFQAPKLSAVAEQHRHSPGLS